MLDSIADILVTVATEAPTQPEGIRTDTGFTIKTIGGVKVSCSISMLINRKIFRDSRKT